jgi:hypothetical protein
MSGLVKVEHELLFKPSPLRMGPESVIKGRWNEAMPSFVDDFLGDTLNTDVWTTIVDNGGVEPAIVAAGANGVAALVVNATDNDCGEWYGTANWFCAQSPIVEVRFAINAITGVAYNVGFVAVPTNSNNLIALTIGGSNAVTVGTNVSEAALFGFDTDADTDVIFALSSKNGGAAQKVQTTLAPVANTYEVVSVWLDPLGNARFFRNGVPIGIIYLAVTVATGLCPYIALKQNATTSRKISVDYVKCWENRKESTTTVW